MTWCKLHLGFPSTSHTSPLRPAHWRRPRSKPPWCLHVARPPERRVTRMQPLFSACTNPEGIDFLLPAQNVPWHQVRQGLHGIFFRLALSQQDQRLLENYVSIIGCSDNKICAATTYAHPSDRSAIFFPQISAREGETTQACAPSCLYVQEISKGTANAWLRYRKANG